MMKCNCLLIEENDSSNEEIGPQLTEEVKRGEPEPLTGDDSWRASVQSTRDWDKGKHLTMERSEQAWLEKQRAEREEKFAPPSFYYDTPSVKYNNGKGNSVSQNKMKSQRSSGNLKEESNMASMVEKQLSAIRKNIDQEACKVSNKNVSLQKDEENSPVCKGGSDNYTISPDLTDADKLPSRFSGTSDNIPSQSFSLNASAPDYSFSLPNFNIKSSDYQIPPLSFRVPPPNLNVPPPSLNVPPPDLNVPPPSLNVPPPNFSIPPPNCAHHHGNNSFAGTNSSPLSSYTSVSYSSTIPENSAGTVGINQVGQQTAKQTEEKVGKKFVPKFDIIDTRLMGNENN